MPQDHQGNCNKEVYYSQILKKVCNTPGRRTCAGQGRTEACTFIKDCGGECLDVPELGPYWAIQTGKHGVWVSSGLAMGRPWEAEDTVGHEGCWVS